MKKTNSHGQAFTLVELVVALGITAVLAALLLSIITNTLDLWRRGAANLQGETTAGLVLDRVSTDLAGWVSMSGQLPWRRIDGGDSGTIEWRFLSDVASTAAGDGDPSGIRQVVLVWDEDSLRLYRWESSVLACLESEYNLNAVAASTGAEWLLAEGVQEFEVRWLNEAREELVNTTGEAEPLFAQVTLTLIDEAGRDRLQAVHEGRSTESPDEIVTQATRTMTTWVALPAGGLR